MVAERVIGESAGSWAETSNCTAAPPTEVRVAGTASAGDAVPRIVTMV